MKKETHISEFTNKRGSGLHIRVSTTRQGRRVNVDGGRIYFSDFSSKHEAMRQAKSIRDSILMDLKLRPTLQTPTVKDLYKQSYELFPVAVSTRTLHDSIFDRYLSELENRPITEVTRSDVQMTVNKYAETHSQVMLKRIVTIWRRIYKASLFADCPTPDLSQMVVMPKSKILRKERDTTLLPAELDKFIDVVTQYKSWKAKTALSLTWVMYYTGMRTTEALALSVEDIDLERSVIHVRKQVGSTASEWADIVPPKTDGSTRTIPISEGLHPVLETLIDESEGLLFTDPDGGIVSSDSISTYIAGICRKKGIKFSLYRLRHLFSADLFRAGVNPKVIQSLMGHEHETMSLYYAFVNEDERVSAIEKRRPS